MSVDDLARHRADLLMAAGAVAADFLDAEGKDSPELQAGRREAVKAIAEVIDVLDRMLGDHGGAQ